MGITNSYTMHIKIMGEPPRSLPHLARHLLRNLVGPRRSGAILSVGDVADPERTFQDRFEVLVEASGLSIRDVEKRTAVGRSTIHGWKRGKALPQNRSDLIKVVQQL